MRMLRWARGKTRLDHVTNLDIWKEAHMYPMGESLREKRLRWCGHVQRRDKDDATRKILPMTVDGKQNRGRPKLRWRDLVKEDMARNRMTTKMAEDRKHWYVRIQAGRLRSVEAKRWEEEGEKKCVRDEWLDWPAGALLSRSACRTVGTRRPALARAWRRHQWRHSPISSDCLSVGCQYLPSQSPPPY